MVLGPAREWRDGWLAVANFYGARGLAFPGGAAPEFFGFL
jgi:hypothetical protein